MRGFLSFPLAAALVLALMPLRVSAQLNAFALPGPLLSITGFLGMIVSKLGFWIIPVVTAIFLVGAFLTVAGSFSEEYSKLGKSLMSKSLLGLAVTLLAYGIIRTVVYLLYF